MTAQPKKMLIICILDILKTHSDADHRLSQEEIRQLLETQYQMVVDRKSIKRNLMNLKDWGYPLSYSETPRVGKNGESEMMLSDFYLEREFTDAELRLMVDSLLFSKHIPYKQCMRMIRKVEGLASRYFKSKVKHVHTLPENLPRNPELFVAIEVLDEAIGKGRQVEFEYQEYGVDKKLHPRTDEAGKVRKYLVNPYQMVAANGRYYLIGNLDKYDNVAHYRVDRIKRICLVDHPVKPATRIKELRDGLNLPQHMAEHIYMLGGESVRAGFLVDRHFVSDVLDWFGCDVTFREVGAQTVRAEVRVNSEAMCYWAMQYANHVQVVSPPSLVERIKRDLRAAAEKYGI